MNKENWQNCLYISIFCKNKVFAVGFQCLHIFDSAPAKRPHDALVWFISVSSMTWTLSKKPNLLSIFPLSYRPSDLENEFRHEFQSAVLQLKSASHSHVLGRSDMEELKKIFLALTFMKSLHGHGLSYREADMEDISRQSFLKTTDEQREWW